MSRVDSGAMRRQRDVSLEVLKSTAVQSNRPAAPGLCFALLASVSQALAANLVKRGLAACNILGSAQKEKAPKSLLPPRSLGQDAHKPELRDSNVLPVDDTPVID